MFAYDLSICSNDYCHETNLSKFGWIKSMCSWLLWVKNFWRVKWIWTLSVLQYQEDPGERGLTVKSGMTAVNKILSLPTKHLSVTTSICRSVSCGCLCVQPRTREAEKKIPRKETLTSSPSRICEFQDIWEVLFQTPSRWLLRKDILALPLIPHKRMHSLPTHIWVTTDKQTHIYIQTTYYLVIVKGVEGLVFPDLQLL